MKTRLKDYNIRLHVGKIDLGVYNVQAYTEQDAFEMAWGLAECDFWAESVKEKE